MASDAGQPRPTLLVVDDTPESLSFLTSTLERADHTVLIANDGAAALALLEHIIPDLILMDAVMPGLDGFATTRRIKADPRWAHVPVIFMTGLTETEHVVDGFAAGGVDYVAKPVVVEELLARVRVHLANARITRSSQVALDSSGRAVVALTTGGEVVWTTPKAAALLADLFTEWQERRELPSGLLQTLRRLQTEGPGDTISARVEIAGERIELMLLGRNGADEWLFRISQTGEAEEERALSARHGLTRREAEVLLWISRGKPNREISEILGISPRTVNKHLEQVFEKMGVENRAAAAAAAVRTLSLVH
jgi:DNA-binding response OmpR family regulator/DNA-binding CsgD family transcriptional regulator